MISINDKSIGYIFSKENNSEITTSGNFDLIPSEIKNHVIEVVESLAKKFNGTNAVVVGNTAVGQIVGKVIVNKASIKKLTPIFKSFGFTNYKFIGGDVTTTKGEGQDQGSYGIHFKYKGKGTTIQDIDITVMYDANIPATSIKWSTNFI